MSALHTLNKKLLVLPLLGVMAQPGLAQVPGTHISDDRFVIENRMLNQSDVQINSQTVPASVTKTKKTEATQTVNQSTLPPEKASVVTDAQLPSAADLTMSDTLADKAVDSNDRDDADVSMFSNLYLSLAVLMLMGAAVLAVYILMNRRQLWYGSRY